MPPLRVRCAAFIPGGFQCHLEMYHTGNCVFEPYKPFSPYLELESKTFTYVDTTKTVVPIVIEVKDAPEDK